MLFTDRNKLDQLAWIVGNGDPMHDVLYNENAQRATLTSHHTTHHTDRPPMSLSLCILTAIPARVSEGGGMRGTLINVLAM